MSDCCINAALIKAHSNYLCQANSLFEPQLTKLHQESMNILITETFPPESPRKKQTNSEEMDFNLGRRGSGAAADEPHLTPSSRICTFTAVTVVTLTFPVSSWERGTALFNFVAADTRKKRTHRQNGSHHARVR